MKKARRHITIGDKFGRLVVTDSLGSTTQGRSKWRCRCDCGSTTTATSNVLFNGHKKSCGCLSAERISNLRHGATIRDDRLLKTPRWRAHCAWVAFRARCNNERGQDYENYGGRGITYDPRWDLFENFLEDMGEPPIGTSLDRKDNDGPYDKTNCRWASKVHQMRNRRNCRHLTYNGVTKTMAEWSRDLGIGHTALIGRLKRGWSVDRALSEPSGAAPAFKSRSFNNLYTYVLGLPE